MNGGGIRPLVTVAAATAALLLPLSACGGGEQDSNGSSQQTAEPDDTSESSPSPTPTSSPTPSMPPLPAEAKEKSDDGAAAFGKYYIDLWRRSEQADHFDELEQYHAPDCGLSCESMVPSVGGHFVEGGEWNIGYSEGFEQPEKNRWNASVVFEIKAGEFVYHTPNPEPTTFPRQSLVAQLQLKYKEGMWEVKRVAFDTGE